MGPAIVAREESEGGVIALALLTPHLLLSPNLILRPFACVVLLKESLRKNVLQSAFVLVFSRHSFACSFPKEAPYAI